MRVRGDAEEAVWPPVAAAPYFGRVAPRRAEDRYPGILEVGRALTGSTGDVMFAAHQGADQHTGRAGTGARPPVKPTEERVTKREQRWPAVVPGSVKEHDAPFVGIALPGRLYPFVYEGRHAVRHRAQQPPCIGADRCTRGVSLDRGKKTELGHEAVIVRGELAVDPRGKGVVGKLALEQPRGTGA